MIWDKPITADGCTATPEQMTEAWEQWGKGLGPRTALNLAGALRRAGAVGTNKYWPTARVADRMLQKARKAGVIRFEGGRWHLVEREMRP